MTYAHTMLINWWLRSVLTHLDKGETFTIARKLKLKLEVFLVECHGEWVRVSWHHPL